MPDFLPGADNEFNTFLTKVFIPYFVAHYAELGFTLEEAGALEAAGTAWSSAYSGHTRAAAAADAALAEKDLMRRLAEAIVRPYTARMQANANVTAEQKSTLGIPVYKTTRTPAAVPSTTPAMQRIDTSTRTVLRLFIVDSMTAHSRAKPAGVQGCEIRYQIGGTPPTNPKTMDFLAPATRSPYRAVFQAEDVGKTVYFALRWMNTRLQPGPWSQIYSSVVPG